MNTFSTAGAHCACMFLRTFFFGGLYEDTNIMRCCFAGANMLFQLVLPGGRPVVCWRGAWRLLNEITNT